MSTQAEPLATRPLGRTGLAVTKIGFGAGPLGGFYGAVDAVQGAAAARRAYELGVRYFDVAPLYGHGRAELALGHGLRDLPRDSFILSTKVGRFMTPAGTAGRPARVRNEGVPFNPTLDYSRDGTLRSLEQSLLRIGTSRVDIVFIHDVDVHSQGSEEAAEAAFQAALRGALPTLLELKAQGTIGAVGIGLNQPAWAMRWLREADLDAVMLAGRLTLLNREAEDGVLAECNRRGVAYIAAGAFNGGILARGGHGGWRFNYRPATEAVMKKYEAIDALTQAHGVGMKRAAIQFPLRHRDVATLVIGASSPAEVDENLRLAREPISQAFWDAVQSPCHSESPARPSSSWSSGKVEE